MKTFLLQGSILTALFLTACSSPAALSNSGPQSALPTVLATAVASVAAPTRVPISPTPDVPQSTPTTAPTGTPAPVQHLCTPLQDEPFEQLPTLVSNPYHPPKPGSDEPHAGIDLALRLPDSQVATAGHPVQAALAGQVAMVAHDRFPFGNALIIETPLDESTLAWFAPVEIPTPAAGPTPQTALTCPGGFEPAFANPDQRSLYILYAHLQQPSTLKPGDPVGCGEGLGTVGQSGNALNPHLHFEVRIGPSGLRMNSMAHYDASASAEEMSNYCLWSVSEKFQLIDPLKLLALTP